MRPALRTLPALLALPALAAAPARPEDVSTLDGIVKAFYEVVSGPAGQPRQWDRDRTLYIPDVRFVAVDRDPKTGRAEVRVLSHEAYVKAVDAAFVKHGFFEAEVHREVRRFGALAHVFSTYESRLRADGPVIERGVNSLELHWDGSRWWISAVGWDGEAPGNPIPKDLLP